MADNDMSFRQRAVIEFLVKEEIPAAEIHQRLQRAYGSVWAVFEDGWNILKVEKRRQFRKQCVSVFGWLERSSTAGEFSNFQNTGRNVYKEVAIMRKNKESYVDLGGVFGLSIIKHVTLQKIVAHDFRYDPRM